MLTPWWGNAASTTKWLARAAGVVIRGLDVRVRVEVKEKPIWKVEERQVFHAQFTLVKVAVRRGVEAMMMYVQADEQIDVSFLLFKKFIFFIFFCLLF